MNLLLASLLAVAATYAVFHLLTVLFILIRSDKAKVKELKQLQGGVKYIWTGQLKEPPSHLERDFRVITGLEYADGAYKSQSRLSIEAIKAAFFAKR